MRQRLREVARQKGDPSWYYLPELDYLKAAKAWGIDPDRWDEMSDEAKGEAVAAWRAERDMSAWESHYFRAKGT